MDRHAEFELVRFVDSESAVEESWIDFFEGLELLIAMRNRVSA